MVNPSQKQGEKSEGVSIENAKNEDKQEINFVDLKPKYLEFPKDHNEPFENHEISSKIK